MASDLSFAQVEKISAALSEARLQTYKVAAGFSMEAEALQKYSWHALTSAAFFASLHVCEVAVRNGVDVALTAVYGQAWPWSLTFEQSLPNPGGLNFRPREELLRARAKIAVGEKDRVVAELKFAFWCHMFTSRYQNRIWDVHIRSAFPDLPITLSPAQARQAIHNEVDSLRRFRNRIAHHEPILAEPLHQRQVGILALIRWRCVELSIWHSTWESVTASLGKRP